MQLIIILFATLLFVSYAALILYYRAAWKSIQDFRHPVSSIQHPVSITIIIPARNEEANLPILLNGLVAQSYDKNLFEVIVVDDHSTDKTAEIVKQFSNQQIILISLKDHIQPGTINAYKKKAIEVAIAKSSGELIVTTDADCNISPKWLQTIASFYDQQKPALIVMPVSYDCKNNFLEIFQALDFMTLQGITGAAVYKNAHSMCNGANLAYSRKAFDEVEGFKGINDIASGDDMLLMHKIFRKYPNGIKYLKSTDVIVSTKPMHTWKDFLNQRIRWASKADKYDDKRIFAVLLVVYIFNVIMLLLPLLSIFHYYKLSLANWQLSILDVWLLLLVLKTITELFFLYPVAVFFKKQQLLWFFPLAQPFHIIYTIVAGWLGKFGTYQWKERKVK